MTMAEIETPDVRLMEMTAGIVASFVATNRVPASTLADLIVSVHARLSALALLPTAEPAKARRTSAQVKRLITPEGLISLINNKPFKTLRRHIGVHGYTPETYREHFGLPAEFPMIHPQYLKDRSELAKRVGLGRFGRRPASAQTAARKRKGG